jgi:hypothetical protein
MARFVRATVVRIRRILDGGPPPLHRDRGDVPGWVLITVMTAGLVSALWLVADDQLANLFTGAMSAVTGP